MDSRFDLGLAGLEGTSAGRIPLLGRRRCSCSGDDGRNWLSRLLEPPDDSMSGMRPVILGSQRPRRESQSKWGSTGPKCSLRVIHGRANLSRVDLVFCCCDARAGGGATRDSRTTGGETSRGQQHTRARGCVTADTSFKRARPGGRHGEQSRRGRRRARPFVSRRF